MRILSAGALLVALVASGCGALSQRSALPPAALGSSDLLPPGNYDVELQQDGRLRYYLVHVPAQVRQGEPLPVVLNFHGGGGAAEQHRQWTRMDALADEQGVLAVYPGGVGKMKRRLLTWNAGNCCGISARDAVDDVAFVVALLEDLAAKVPVDATRVYATGLSNGAMMSYRLAHAIPGRIAAIAPVAGTSQSDAAPTAVPLLHIHSVDDPRALYEGGRGPPFPFTTHRVEHRAVRATVGEWARANGCNESPRQTERFDGEAGTAASHHSATLLAYEDCNEGVEVAHWRLTGAGHVWPGSPKALRERWVGPASTLLDGNRVIWEFFRRHRRPDAPPLTGASGDSDWRERVQRPTTGLRAIADEVIELPLEQTSFRLTGELVSEGRNTERDRGFSDRGLHVGGGTSFYSRVRKQGDALSFAHLGAVGSLRIGRLNLRQPNHETRTARGSLGLAALWMPSPSHFYFFYAGAGMAESFASFDDPEVRPVALALGAYRFNRTWMLLYGGAFAYLWGRGLALPALGGQFRHGRITLTALLPLALRAGVRVGDELQLGLALAADGDLYRLPNEGLVPDAGAMVRVSARQLRLALSARYPLSRNLSGTAQFGVLGGRRFAFRNRQRVLSERELDPALYASIGLAYAAWQ